MFKYINILYYIIIISITLFKININKSENNTKIIFNYLILPWIIFSAIGHIFLSKTVSNSIGWSVSPYQYELGFFTLALFIIGYYINYKNYSIKSYKIIIYIWLTFTFLCTLLHIKDIIYKKNYSYNNIIPIIITYIIIFIYFNY